MSLLPETPNESGSESSAIKVLARVYVRAAALARAAAAGAMRHWKPIAAGAIAFVLLIVLIPVGVRELQKVGVPELIGVTAAEAEATMKELRLEADWPSWVSFSNFDSYRVVDQEPAAGTRLDPDATVELDLEIVVPDLVASSVEETREALRFLPLELETDVELSGALEPFFEVVGQAPAAGSALAHGEVVRVRTAAMDVVVPNLDVTFTLATKMLTAVGLLVQKAESPQLPAGLVASGSVIRASYQNAIDWRVVGQSVPGGTRVSAGTTIVLTMEPPTVVVPKVTGLTPGEVDSVLEPLGISANTSTIPGNWRIIKQSPSAGSRLLLGDEVVLTARAPQIVFSVSGNGSTALITWIAPGSFSIQQDTNASIPWSVSFDDNGFDAYERGNFSAQIYDGDSITCTVTVDGKVVDSRTSRGAYAVVSCG